MATITRIGGAEVFRSLRQRVISRAALYFVLVFLLFFGVEVGLQWISGAYSSEFDDPDEPAHYVTGLMIRDYVAARAPAPPLAYAENYYLHYPKVSFGLWPPFLHMVEAGWMLVFSESRTSILLLMALLPALLAVTLYRVIRSEFSRLAGLAAGLLWLCQPVVLAYSGRVMGDTLIALLDFWAVLCFGRFLDTEKWRDAVLFGLLASLSIISKGNGMALVFVPPLAVLLCRRFHLIKTRAFWYPALIVLMIAGPWQYLSARLLAGIGYRQASLEIAGTYLYKTLTFLGFGLLPFVVVGVITRVVAPFPRKAVEGRWAALAALPVGVWALHAILPSAGVEPRYMIPTIPPLVMFFTAGVAWVSARVPLRGWPVLRKAALLTGLLAPVFAAESFRIPQRSYYGFAEAAQSLVGRPEFRNSVFLVSAQGAGEGMFISEVAMRERRPGHVILRASKVLSQSDWDGERYELLHRDPQETMKYLESIPVQVLVLDARPSARRRAHHENLLKMLEMYPDRWKLFGVYPQRRPATASPGGVRVYRLVGQSVKPTGKIRIPLKYTLRKTIEGEIGEIPQ